ncbi:hypothetical protein UlMin_038277 [Ulmus minor]
MQNGVETSLIVAHLTHLIKSQPFDCFPLGGLFLDPTYVVPPSFVSLISSKTLLDPCLVTSSSPRRRRKTLRIEGLRGGNGFLSVSLSIKREGGDGDGNGGYVGESGEVLGQNGNECLAAEAVAGYEEGESEVVVRRSKEKGSGAMNMTNHLWAGAVSAMVSRTFVAPLERLKLEYIVRGEQKNLFELIGTIFASQGIKGFWKGNFVNILRTAPFKSINFYAYDRYRNHLMRMSGNEENTNFERFLAGAAAGITATLLCLPMDTIRTKMVAPGGEALGGVIGTCRHMIQTEGFFSLYKGLVPSIVSMAPSGAVFYGVYDILKTAYLHSPEGMKRIQHMKQEGQELNALEQLELGPIRTLLYGAIAGVCSEAATYPFEVVRRQLQMQVWATRRSALSTFVKIVEQGGIPALYAGLVPSLLQVLPSASISYFVYEFMKIVLKVEST